ncbi:MAG: arsenate reductase ArsC [bacterium]
MRVLVLCTGNSCRSQMAEGFFRHYGKGKIEAFSAGLAPKPIHPMAISVMSELGIDISLQTSKHLAGYLGEDFDLVVTVCDNAAANCPTFHGAGQNEHWPFDDPDKAIGTEGERLAEFRRVRDEIRKSIEDWFESM